MLDKLLHTCRLTIYSRRRKLNHIVSYYKIFTTREDNSYESVVIGRSCEAVTAIIHSLTHAINPTYIPYITSWLWSFQIKSFTDVVGILGFAQNSAHILLARWTALSPDGMLFEEHYNIGVVVFSWWKSLNFALNWEFCNYKFVLLF